MSVNRGPAADLISQAHNLWGHLDHDTRSRLHAAITHPSIATWDAAYELIITHGTARLGGMQLWYAVCAVDPTFQRTASPHLAVEPGVPGWVHERDPAYAGWGRAPDACTLVRALRYAVTGER